jgi:hypothetical protein
LILALVRQANQGGDPWTSAALALSLNRPFDAMAWHRELRTILTRALEVAAGGDDHLTLARLRNVLGTACRELRQFEEALEHLGTAATTSGKRDCRRPPSACTATW